MNFLLLLLKSTSIILLISILLVYLLNKKIGLVIPISFCIIGLLYYFSGLIFNSFYLGRVSIYVLVIASIFLLFFNKKNKIFKDNIFTPGLIVFFIIVLLTYIYCYRYRFSSWDEFSHWGPMLKTMFYHDSFYTQYPDIGGAHIEYPPFISLIELFFCNIYGFYSEYVASIALHVLELSFIFPVIFDIFSSKNKYEKSVFSLLIIVTIIIFDIYPTFRTIYIDIPISLMSIYPILLIMNEKIRESKEVYLLVTISLSCIMLTKQIGIAFVLCDIFIYFCYLFFVNTNLTMIKKLTIIFTIILVLVSVYLSWSIYVKQFNLVEQFDLSKIINKLLLFDLNNSQKCMIRKFVDYLLHNSVINGIISIPYVYYFTILLLLYFFILLESNLKKSEKSIYLLAFLISNIGYIIVIFTIMCFAFSDVEMINLNSIDRYLSSITIYSIIIIFLLLFNSNNTTHQHILAITIVLFILSFDFQIELLPRIMLNTDNYKEEYRNSQLVVANYINDYIKNGDNILILSYYAVDVPRFQYLTDGKCNFYVDEIYYGDSDFINKLLEYDYVVFGYDDMRKPIELLSRYCNSKMLYKDVLYKVVQSGKGIELVMMC